MLTTCLSSISVCNSVVVSKERSSIYYSFSTSTTTGTCLSLYLILEYTVLLILHRTHLYYIYVTEIFLLLHVGPSHSHCVTYKHRQQKYMVQYQVVHWPGTNCTWYHVLNPAS